MPAYLDPDDQLVVTFKNLAIENHLKTLEAGRPIFDDVEHCFIRSPGSPDVKVFPAASFARWVGDPFGRGQTQQSYAERFSQQYRQFKAQEAQTKSGTPLDYAPFLSEARRAELKAQNVYTVEALADIEGNELKNLGPGGRDMKNQAMAYIEESRLVTAPSKQMLAELEALKARNAVLEEDLQRKQQFEATADVYEFDNMSDKQLRDFITTNTGQAPQGNVARRTLVRMATDAKPKEVAA
jgi:hypothetical protein